MVDTDPAMDNQKSAKSGRSKKKQADRIYQSFVFFNLFKITLHGDNSILCTFCRL